MLSLATACVLMHAVFALDVLVPLSTTAPSSTIYPHVVHPRQPQRLNLPNRRPLHTNKFYTNAIIGTSKNPLFVHPFVLIVNFETPFGLSVSHTEEWSFGPAVDSTRVKYFINTIHKNIQVSAVEFTAGGQQVEVIDVDEPGFSATLKLHQQGSQASLTVPMVRGMAYVTFEYNAATPRIATVHAIVSVNGKASGTFTGRRFELALNNGQTWLIYALQGDVTLQLTSNQLVGTEPINNVLRFAKKQADAEANKVLDAHASVYPVGCRLSADVTGSKGTYKFNWLLKGDTGNAIVHFAFPHHRQVLALSSGTTLTTIRAQSSTKGEMVGVIGNTWTLEENQLSTMGFLPPRAPAAQYDNYIRTQLKSDLATSGAELTPNDYYFTGKEFHKYALLCLLADAYKETSLRSQCVQTLEAALNVLIEGRNAHPLKYDTTWSGLVSAAGLGASQELADFGNSYYNDHHYHWGYFVQTGAILAHLDPSYIPKMKSWIESLVRDANNPSPQDTSFPQFRYFDWFSGHSWSQGLFESADGKDQESTSEEINFHYGLALWGAATQSATLEGLGRLMMAAAKRSIQTYFLMLADNTVMPKQFIGNKVTGIFFENKADYATWFGANPEFIHGIQMIPCTPIIEELRLPKFIEEEWTTILSKVVNNAVEGWKSLLYMNYATISRGEAFSQLLSVPLDNGVSRAWALYWAATRPNTNDGTGTLPPITTTTQGSGGSTSTPGGPVTGGECTLPAGNSCTQQTPSGDAAAGLGLYYEAACSTQGGVGCGHIQPYCRLCAKDPSVINKPYIKCPSCVI